MNRLRAVRTRVNGAIVVVGLTMAMVAVPTVERVRPGKGPATARNSLRLIARLCGIRFVITGEERLDSGVGSIVVANHASPIDIAAMLVASAEVRFAAAAELFRLPLLGGAMRALGSVPVDRARPRAALTQLSKEVETLDGSLVVFAEGGIPPVGEVVEFKTGAFALAIESGRPVIPVSIGGSGDVLPRGARVWARPGTISVRVHQPIETHELKPSDRRRLRDEVERIVRASMVDARVPG